MSLQPEMISEKEYRRAVTLLRFRYIDMSRGVAYAVTTSNGFYWARQPEGRDYWGRVFYTALEKERAATCGP